MRLRGEYAALLIGLVVAGPAGAQSDPLGASAWVRIKRLLTGTSCATTDGPCDLADGTTMNSLTISTKSCIRADSTRILANQSTTQALFNSPTNGRLTISTGLYHVDAYVSLSSMSASSGNFRFDPDGAGTATLAAIAMSSSGRDAAVNDAGSALGGSHWTGTGLQPTTDIVTAAIGTGAAVQLLGSFEVSVAGTIIPNVALTSAAAAVVDVGTYFCVERIGSTTMTSVGLWD